MTKHQLDKVNQAFSKQSLYFDEYDQKNQILVDMRQQVRRHVLQYIKKGDSILELNAGTGLDAHFFVEQGCKVYATDIADGMIAKIKEKVESFCLQDNLKVRQISFTDLDMIEEKDFDYIFSNFGGLNCVDDLSKVSRYFPHLLKKNAYITLVLMPFICPWEIMMLFTGRFSYAFRRWKRKGTLAHLEGEYFKTYYFTPQLVKKSFGKDYKIVKLEGLGSISPPPDREQFPTKYPALYNLLKKTDARLKYYYPFNHWADHFIITLQYLPQ